MDPNNDDQNQPSVPADGNMGGDQSDMPGTGAPEVTPPPPVAEGEGEGEGAPAGGAPMGGDDNAGAGDAGDGAPAA